VWQRRHGGNLVQMYPYVISARVGMQRHLPRMDAYVAKARAVAAALTEAAIPGLALVPNPPHTNMMHVFVHGDRENIIARGLEASRASGIFMVPRSSPTRLPDQGSFEWTVGEATLDVTEAEIVGLFRAIFV
jgi:threonine aldolase